MDKLFCVEQFEAYLDNPTDADAGYAIDAYSHLAGYMFESFTQGKGKLQTGGVRHGFNVITRLIRIAANLYTDEYKEGPDETQLQQILLSSVETPTRIASLPHETNSHIEKAFGLKTDTVPNDVRSLYKFEENTSRGTLFIFDDERFSAEMSFAIAPSAVAGEGLKKCRMIELVRGQVWPQTVDVCAHAPALFAQTLDSRR